MFPKLVSASARHKQARKLYKETAQKFMEINDRWFTWMVFSGPVLILVVEHAAPAFEAAALLEKDEFKDEWDADPYKLFESAYSAYHETRPDDAARCMQEISKHWTSSGNYRAAAPKQEQLGDLYAKSGQDMDKAIDAWQKAGNWYKNSQAIA